MCAQILPNKTEINNKTVMQYADNKNQMNYFHIKIYENV